jgi:uncharacterized protein (TIGR02391 family)
MARRSNPPPPKPPSISKSEGRRRLAILVERGEALLAQRALKEGQEDVWSTACIEALKATFGNDSTYIYTYIGQQQITISTGDDSYDHYAEKRDAERITRRIGVLRMLIEQIELEIGFEVPSPPAEDFWSKLHPSVTQVAQDRFNSSHYADAVEAAFKELNAKVKAYMKRATGNEFDGADLMQRVFSPKAPVVRLADLSTEDGKNIQQGYMQIFAGAMTGIRNPKAHSNIVIDAPRAIHFLHLASLLHFVFDERF